MSIRNGIIHVVPASGKPVPDDWQAAHERDIVRETALLLGIAAYSYVRHSTGNYVVSKGKRRSGITLQFTSLVTGEAAYSNFNANLTYIRNGENHKVGDPYPKGQFSVKEGSNFYKFWNHTKLKHPESKTRYHDYLGNLKGITFTAEVTANWPKPGEDDRLVASSLRPLNIEYADLLHAHTAKGSPHKCHTAPAELAHISRIGDPHKETSEAYTAQSFEEKPTTGALSCGKRLIGSAVNGRAIQRDIGANSPADQTVEQWLQDYDGHQQ